MKARGVPVDDIIILPMADHRLLLYGDAILISTTFAAQDPDAVRGFLRAYVKGLQETIRDPAHAIESVIDEVLGRNPDKVTQVKTNEKVLGWFVGQVMKGSGGKANPQTVNALLRKKLGL